jgi:hypothetical protein
VPIRAPTGSVDEIALQGLFEARLEQERRPLKSTGPKQGLRVVQQSDGVRQARPRELPALSVRELRFDFP